MSKVKYYQMTERAQECASIGVIKQEGNRYPLHEIKEALESHFDEEVNNISVKHYSSTGDIEISFDRNGEKETVDGAQTWLYF